MLITAHYLIRPKKAFLDLLSQFPQFYPFFANPRIWSHEEGGHLSPKADEYTLGIKLLFIVQFRSDCLRLRLDNREILLEKMMGKPPFGVRVFDNWWDLERFQLSEEFIHAIARIDPKQMGLLEKTGLDQVDSWMASLKKLKENKKTDI